MPRFAGPLTVAVAVLAFASSAQAATQTRYVSITGNDAGGTNTCTDAASPCRSITEAKNQAQSGDTISIGAGTFDEGVSINKSLTFQGVSGSLPGPVTFVTAAAFASPAFTTGNVAVTFKNMVISGGVAPDGGGGHVLPAIEGGGVGHPVVSIVGCTIEQPKPPNPDAWDQAVDYNLGANLTAQLDISQSSVTGFGSGVAVAGGAGGSVQIDRSTVSASTAQPPMLAGATAGALFSQVPTTINDSTVSAFDAVSVDNQPLVILRSRIDAADQGLAFEDLNGGATVSVRDSTIEPAANTELDAAILVGTPISETTEPTISLVGDTIIARSSSRPVALDLDTAAAGTTLQVHNTILHATPVMPGGLSDDITVASATNWDVGTSMFTKVFGSGVPAPGSGTNINAVPSATNTIDKGDPSQVQPGETDEADHPRVVDGDCDGVALPDIGAFEAPACGPPPSPPATTSQNPPPPAPPGDRTPPKLTHVSFANSRFAVAASTRKHRAAVHRGTKLRFTLSEAATVKVVVALVRHRGHHTSYQTMGAVTYRKQKQGADSNAFTGKVAGRKLAPGTYRATITATDAAGTISAVHHLIFVILRT